MPTLTHERELAIWPADTDYPHPPLRRTLALYRPNKRLPVDGTDLIVRLRWHHERDPLPPGKYMARYFNEPEGEAVRFRVDSDGSIHFGCRPPLPLPTALDTEREKLRLALQMTPHAFAGVQLGWTVSPEMRTEVHDAGYHTFESDRGTYVSWGGKPPKPDHT